MKGFKRRQGDTNRTIEAYTTELKFYETAARGDHARRRQAGDPRYDILEGMAGAAVISRMAPTFGLKAMTPCDVCYGWGLSTDNGRRQWKSAVTHGKPLVAIWGFQWTEWLKWNMHTNYTHRLDEWHERQDRMRPRLELYNWTALHQIRNGRYFLYENPSTTEIFDQPECTFSKHPSTYVRKGHGCMNGIIGEDGLLMAKAQLGSATRRRSSITSPSSVQATTDIPKNGAAYRRR